MQGEPLKIPEVRFIARSLFEAVDFAHSKGIAHRDLKLENLLFDNDFRIKLIDFGFSAEVGGSRVVRDGCGRCGDTVDTVFTEEIGTEMYMAPEIYEHSYKGVEVDLFALGVILFLLVAQNRPFNVAKKDDKIYRLLASGD